MQTCLNLEVRIFLNPKPETQNLKPRSDARLHRVFGPLVFRLAQSLFDSGIGDGEDSNGDKNNDSREHKTLSAVCDCGDHETQLRELIQGELEGMCRTRPSCS